MVLPESVPHHRPGPTAQIVLVELLCKQQPNPTEAKPHDGSVREVSASGTDARVRPTLLECRLQRLRQSVDVVRCVVEMTRDSQQALTVPPSDGDFDLMLGP